MHAETEGRLIQLALGQQWNDLSTGIQRRFENEPSPAAAKRYTGVMTEVHCSPPGRCLTYVTRLINAPLIPYNAQNVPIDVTVYKNPETGDIHKDRIYYFRSRKPFRVCSHMRLASHGQFQEYVSSWLGMDMRLYARDGNLHFESTRYFIKLGAREISLPFFLSPGKAHITHRDHGRDGFQVTIDMVHPWFGRMFFQDGVFKEEHV